MEKDKPNFWAVTPAYVRYHDGISDFAKLIYSEIMALSNRNGHCHANNNYFEKVFNKSQPTISKAITDLADAGLIEVMSRDGSTPRVITPLVKVDSTTPYKKEVGEVKETFSHNNTSINNTSISNTNVLDEEEKISLPPKTKLPVSGKSSINRLVSFYSALWKAKYGTSPTVNYPRAGRVLKPLLDSLGEYGSALVVLQYFHWRGATGDDSFLVRRLDGATHPIYWIPDFADAIRAYLRNVVKLDVDSEDQVKMVVDRKLTELGIRAQS